MTSALPFDDIRDLLAKLPEADENAAARVRTLFAKADKQKNSLGRIEEIAEWLAAWTGRAPPFVRRPLVAIFAGNHGVARHGISPRPVAATANAVELCAAGGAAINQICVAYDLGLKVFDLALHIPTGDITGEAALDERGCAATMAFGMEAIADGTDLLCLGDLGVGNSTVAAALLAALFGGDGAEWVGPGSGADETMMARKAAIVDAALAFHGSQLKDPLEALRRVGGREFAAIAGAILAARMQKIPVLIDGSAAFAAAAVLHVANPAALGHCLLASVALQTVYALAAVMLGLRPLLDFGLNHGEGVGAGIAAGIVKAAALCSSGMAAAVREH
jgi:nicotinate-nucleotide--dimethylbenzimidazole phosphoribosyltransferase